VLIPSTPLIATGSFGSGLPAARVAAALACGLRAGGLPAADLCPIPAALARSGDVRAGLDSLGLDMRMRRARAVILGEWRLAQETLVGSVAFEIATRARQSGVPTYAVTGENRLEDFDARILDLQTILTARSTRALAAAGRRLARLI